MECRECSNYEMKDSYCRVQKHKMRRDEYCKYFRIKLADHYVPNAWDEWKKKAEREQLRMKKK